MTLQSSDIHSQSPQTIAFAGDWHGFYTQAEAVLQNMAQNDCHHLLHAGDFGIWNNQSTQQFLKRLNTLAKHFDIQIYFVDGNHEDHPHLQSFPIQPDGTRRIRSNIHHLPRGFRWTWDNINFMALGGAFSVDRAWRKLGHSYFAEEVISDEDIQNSIKDGKIDILISHDSPDGAPNPITDSFQGQINGLRMFGAEAIDQATHHRTLLRQVTDVTDPAIIVHGHYHAYQEASYTRKATGTHSLVLALDEGSAPLYKHLKIAPVSELQRIVEASRAITS